MFGSERKGIRNNDTTRELSGPPSRRRIDLTRRLAEQADAQLQGPLPDTADHRMKSVPEGRAREVNLREACEFINSREQQDYKRHVDLICSDIEEMKRIPNGQKESKRNRLIDQARKAQNECYANLAKMVPRDNNGPDIETSAALFERIQEMARKGHRPTLQLFQHLNSITAIEKGLSELRDTYRPEDLARTYAEIELLMSVVEGGPELKALQTAWNADRPSSSDRAQETLAREIVIQSNSGEAHEDGLSIRVSELTPKEPNRPGIYLKGGFQVYIPFAVAHLKAPSYNHRSQIAYELEMNGNEESDRLRVGDLLNRVKRGEKPKTFYGWKVEIQGSMASSDSQPHASTSSADASSSSHDKNEGHAEQSSQDTRDINQKKRSFLKALPEAFIRDIQTKAKGFKDNKAYERIGHLCRQISLARGFYNDTNKEKILDRYQYREITEDDAAECAISLRTALKKPAIASHIKIRGFILQIDQLYQEAGLS